MNRAQLPGDLGADLDGRQRFAVPTAGMVTGRPSTRRGR